MGKPGLNTINSQRIDYAFQFIYEDTPITALDLAYIKDLIKRALAGEFDKDIWPEEIR